MLEDCRDAGQVLRATDDKGESRRRNGLAGDVAARASRTGMIRTLAVTGVFLVAAGMGLPPDASAQTSPQGQAVGILFLLGASRAGAPANAKTPGQKPKPGIATPPEGEGKIVGMKPKLPSANNEIGLVRVGGGTAVSIPVKAGRSSDSLDGAVLRVTSDQKNGRKLDRPAEATDRTHATHN